jgi:hypothetical protein
MRRARWQPPEEDLPGATAKFAALVCAVAVAVLYAIGREELGLSGLAWTAGWSIGVAVLALLISIYVNTAFTFRKGRESPHATRILGGFRLTEEAARVREDKGLTEQRMYETGGFDPDLVWTRSSRGLVKMLSSTAYLSLQAFGSIGLASAAMLLGMSAQ